MLIFLNPVDRKIDNGRYNQAICENIFQCRVVPDEVIKAVGFFEQGIFDIRELECPYLISYLVFICPGSINYGLIVEKSSLSFTNVSAENRSYVISSSFINKFVYCDGAGKYNIAGEADGLCLDELITSRSSKFDTIPGVPTVEVGGPGEVPVLDTKIYPNAEQRS